MYVKPIFGTKNLLARIVCCAQEKCRENDFRSACLRTEIFLRELTLSSVPIRRVPTP